MDRWNEIWSACSRIFNSYLWIITRTIWVAIYGPLIVFVIGLFVAAVPYYFITLVTGPSWIHLYVGVVFTGVAVYHLWFSKAKDLEFEVRRGRKVERGEDQRRGDGTRVRNTRTDRSRTRIQRGRQ